MADILNSAVLVRMKVGQWSATKTDHAVSREVANRHNVGADAGKYIKKLARSGTLDLYRSNANEMRGYLNHCTMPWQDSGERLLPVSLFDNCTRELRRLRQKASDLADAFTEEFDSMIANARVELGDMFNAGDYPDVSEVRKKFYINVNFTKIGDPSDFRVKVSQDHINKVVEENELRFKEAQKTAADDLWQRLYGCVSHLTERLSDPDNKFKASTVINLRELTDILPSLNIGNDPQLNKLTQDVRLALCTEEPEVLRDDSNIRAQVHVEAEKIKSRMAVAMGI